MGLDGHGALHLKANKASALLMPVPLGLMAQAT